VGYWLVDDLEAAISAAIKLGGKVYRGPLKVDEVQRTIVQIVDPYGGVIGLEAEY
jgi:predicted enzyme related to lactoylglutathione lyase